MSEQKTPGHVLADEAGWRWGSGPQYQEECERIARAVCAAERERVLGEVEAKTVHVMRAEVVALGELAPRTTAALAHAADVVAAAIAKLREESGT